MKLIIVGVMFSLVMICILSAVESGFIGKSAGILNRMHPVHLEDAGQDFSRLESAPLLILYNSSAIDKQFQEELMQAALLALETFQGSQVQWNNLDVSSLDAAKVAQLIGNSETRVLLSLLSCQQHSRILDYLEARYSQQLGKSTEKNLTVVSPRSIITKKRHGIQTFSLQMSPRSLAAVIINRAKTVGVRTLVPVIDDESQNQELNIYTKLDIYGVRFTQPLVLSEKDHEENLKRILNNYTGFDSSAILSHDSKIQFNHIYNTSSIGILLLAEKSSHRAILKAMEKRHLHLGWFSPNILHHEEYALSYADMGRNETMQWKNSSVSLPNRLFGIYSACYVGSEGWENPERRRILIKLSNSSRSSPRILSMLTAYDAAKISHDIITNVEGPKNGLTGRISFDAEGYRPKGTFFGVSSMATEDSTHAQLLQKSSWVLEDIITLEDTPDQVRIVDYDVSTSSIIPKEDILALESHADQLKCYDPLLKVSTYDPFSLVEYKFEYTKNTLPPLLVLINYQGFGLSFSCAEAGTSKKYKNILQIACASGRKYSSEIHCFKTYSQARRKRNSNYNYDYYFNPPTSNNHWDLNSQKWARDDTYLQSYQSSTTKGYGSSSYDIANSYLPASQGYVNDAVENTDNKPATTDSKSPELRQVLKAAKPFVGSCIGSTTGCAMCVLVLGRLPLGILPAACAGPCFVGTFGSCGSLLGRVFSETTVVCTELFKQGLIDVDTFLADAKFGRNLADTSPLTLLGYQIMATPVVEAMKHSSVVTNIVSYLAIPWAEYMKYLMGHSHQLNYFGGLIHQIGLPICYIMGNLITFLERTLPWITQSMNLPSVILLVFSLVTYFRSKSKTKCKRMTQKKKED